MGDREANELDDESLVSVELKLNQSIVNIRRKRLMLKSSSQLICRSRSRSPVAPTHTSIEKRLKWVLPGLIVRVVSKKVEGGKLYNTKLRVTDVLSAYKFHALPLEGAQVLYENLREKDIETVIPREDGAQVALLKGEHKGEVGKILSRDKKKEELTVQVGLTDIVTVHLDDCCAVHGNQ